MMKTLVFSSQKGGSGKTMTATNLAVEIEREGEGPVYLIDGDPQKGLSTWHEARQAEQPRRVETSLSEFFIPNLDEERQDRIIRFEAIKVQFHQTLTVLNQEHKASFCLIDTPPLIHPAMMMIYEMADLIVVPVKATPDDLWGVGATVKMLKEVGKPFLFVVNQATANATLNVQTVAGLSHYGPVARTLIGNRIPYAAAKVDGRSGPELSGFKGPAATEMAGLWMNVKSMLA